jgi:hypothetical protein
MNRNRPYSLGLIFGILLIAIGLLALVGQVFWANAIRYLWPFFIILPGLVVVALALPDETGLGEPFSMIGTMTTFTGLLLFYQRLTGHWTSWAYAWTLVAPIGAGVGLWLYGAVHNREKEVKSGRDLVRIGFIIGLVGLIFFELVLNISGWGLGFIGWPVLFIALGIFLLIRGILRR